MPNLTGDGNASLAGRKSSNSESIKLSWKITQLVEWELPKSPAILVHVENHQSLHLINNKKPQTNKQKKSDKITYDGEKLPNLRLVSSFLNENHLSWKTQALLRKYLKKQCFCMDNVDNVNQVKTVFFCIQHHQVT